MNLIFYVLSDKKFIFDKPNDMSSTNPIIEIYKGVPVRKYCKIDIRIDEITFKQLIDIEEKTKLSARQILAHSSKTCSCCANSIVSVETDSGTVQIPRGLLSKRIPTEGSGTSKKRKING